MNDTLATDHALIVGEALIDVVHRPDGSVEEHPGGSLANVALTLGRLGRGARLLTWIANDPHGQLIREWLTESHVILAEGSDGAEQTSVATAQLDSHGVATYDFNVQWRVAPGFTVDPGIPVVHTGSIATVLEPGASAVTALVRAASATATITYDPNARPTMMGEPSDARQRIEEMVRLADVVKVSDEDIAWLVPEADPVDVARAWQRSGPAIVVVTLGGEGAIAITANSTLTVKAPRVQVVDTVGAGDSFMGALLDGLWSAGLLGAEKREALRDISKHTLSVILERCAAVAAITVSRAGANPPARDELPSLPEI